MLHFTVGFHICKEIKQEGNLQSTEKYLNACFPKMSFWLCFFSPTPNFMAQLTYLRVVNYHRKKRGSVGGDNIQNNEITGGLHDKC